MVLNLQISQIPKNENLEFIHYPYYYFLLVFALPSLKSFHQSVEEKEERRIVGLTILSFLPPGT